MTHGFNFINFIQISPPHSTSFCLSPCAPFRAPPLSQCCCRCSFPIQNNPKHRKDIHHNSASDIKCKNLAVLSTVKGMKTICRVMALLCYSIFTCSTSGQKPISTEKIWEVIDSARGPCSVRNFSTSLSPAPLSWSSPCLWANGGRIQLLKSGNPSVECGWVRMSAGWVRITALHPQSLQSLALLQTLEHRCCFLRSIRHNGKLAMQLVPQALNFEARHEEIETENSMLWRFASIQDAANQSILTQWGVWNQPYEFSIEVAPM